MYVHHRVLAALFLTVLVAADAHAGRRLSPPVPVPPRTEAVNSLCMLGINGPDSPSGAENVVFYDGTDNWLVALKIDAANCATCSLGTQGVIEAANISLFFPLAPCTLTVRTRVVRNFALETCPYPDRFTPNTQCGEFFTTLYATAEDINTVKDFRIPFPNNTCALLPGQTQFLEMNFFSMAPAVTDSLLKPRLMPWQQRITCRTYNGFEGNRFAADVTSAADLEMNNPKIWADIVYCESVATTRRSWGRLKQIYR